MKKQNLKIGIAGGGGIGSNVAVHLIRCGVTNFKIVDFDIIEESNLNRQFYFKDQIGKNKVETLYENLKRINPHANIEIVNERIERTNINRIFEDCEILVEAFDKKEYKKMLIEESYDKKKMIVSASGIADSDLENIKIKKVSPNLYIVGDFSKDISLYKTYSPKVVYIASIMADIVLREGGFYE